MIAPLPTSWETAVTRASGDIEGARSMEERRLRLEAQAARQPSTVDSRPVAHDLPTDDEDEDGTWV